MARIAKTKRREASKAVKRSTSMTLSGEDLSALARLVAGGKVLLQTTHPVMARLKAALTRLGLPVPQGL